jgi:hypothetical protein
MTRVSTGFAVGAIAFAAAGCGFSPTAPFSGFDNQGSRVVGRFDSGAGVSAQGAQSAAAASSASVQGIVVTLQERPSLRATVDSGGAFTLAGVPAGSWSLVFTRDGRVIGEIRFRNVRRNQGIVIVVVLTSNDEVVLLDERRDRVSFSGECPRSPGFWCQNKGGQNPNLSESEFEAFAEKAAELLTGVPALDTPEEVAAAVCNTGDQLLRHLAALALNLAAGTVKTGTALVGEPYATVGAAFDAAVQEAASPSLSRDDRNALKDVLDRINNAQNVNGCDQLPEDDETDPTDADEQLSGQVTICHIPPGNPNARHTITIGASAWPAHKAHGDYLGACK